jgi:hypothetical protein
MTVVFNNMSDEIYDAMVKYLQNNTDAVLTEQPLSLTNIERAMREDVDKSWEI